MKSFFTKNPEMVLLSLYTCGMFIFFIVQFLLIGKVTDNVMDRDKYYISDFIFYEGYPLQFVSQPSSPFLPKEENNKLLKKKLKSLLPL